MIFGSRWRNQEEDELFQVIICPVSATGVQRCFPPIASGVKAITEVSPRVFFFFQMEKLRVFIIMAPCLYSATTAARWDASLSCVDAALPRLQRNFHYFQRGCSFLGGPRHVSAQSMCKYVCIWVCMCQGCALLPACFAIKFRPCGFASVHFCPKLHKSRIASPRN